MKRLQVIVVFLVLFMAAGTLFAGGGGGQAASSASSGSTAGPTSPTLANLGFPLQRPITVTYWAPLAGDAASVMRSFNEKSMWINMASRTNIHIEFEHPSAAAAEAFNLLLASGNLPDIIQGGSQWATVPGGVDNLINDRMILDLTSQVNTNMPNLRKLLNDYPSVDALFKTGEGKYWGFVNVMIDEDCWAGPIMRKDYLDRWNLQIPRTMDDWYNVLRTFKANGIREPLGVQRDVAFVSYGIFIGAYDVVRDYYVGTDGKIHFGPIEDGYRQFLTTFNRWYSEGLIDPEFASIDDATYRSKAITGVYGAYTGASSQQLENFGVEMMRTTPGSSVIGVPYPKLSTGQTLRFRQKSQDIRSDQSVALSARTRYAAEIIKMFDYMYSPEGSFLITFGNEGESYTLNAQGKPVSTQLLSNNPLGSTAAMAAKYMGRTGPFWRDRYEATFLDFSGIQTPARDVWHNSSNAEGIRLSYPIPVADAQRLSSIMADVNTYVNEMFLKFIMGQEPLANFNTYVQNVRRMGIDDAIAIHNAAYSRFMR
jgi:putative aldouronate transport system substrate-binding protein